MMDTVTLLILVCVFLAGIIVGLLVMRWADLRIIRGRSLPAAVPSDPRPSPARQPRVISTYWNPDLCIAIQEIEGAKVPTRRSWISGRSRQPLVERAALDRLVTSVPFIAAALQGGHIVRVVGPEHVLRGVDGGWLQQLGTMGVVTDSAAHRVGQFDVGDMIGAATIAGPLAVWEIAGLVTCQYYLNRITRQLGSLERSLAGLRQFHRNEVGAKLSAARSALDRAGQLPMHALSKLDLLSIAMAGRDLDEVYGLCFRNIQGYASKVQTELSKDRSDVNRGALLDLLTKDADTYRHDVALFCSALQLRAQYLRFRLWVEISGESGGAGTREASVQGELEETRHMLSIVVEGMADLLKRELALTTWETFKSRAWNGKTLARDLRDCQEALEPLYAVASQVLPDEMVRSAVIEMWEDPSSGGVKGAFLPVDSVERG